ncbi:MAG: twin-arginine translocase TatA/TatE family subunit [Thermomicrobiales bacterium]
MRDLLQPWHLLIVLAIILLIFGPGKLSGLGSALGSSIRDFKKATKDDDEVGAGMKTAGGNVKSVADDDAPVHALAAKSIVIDPAPSAAKSVVDLDDDDAMAVPVGGNGSAPIKIGGTRKGYSRR